MRIYACLYVCIYARMSVCLLSDVSMYACITIPITIRLLYQYKEDIARQYMLGYKRRTQKGPRFRLLAQQSASGWEILLISGAHESYNKGPVLVWLDYEAQTEPEQNNNVQERQNLEYKRIDF